MARPVVASISRAVVSFDPAASRSPSGLKASRWTESLNWTGSPRRRPVARSQSTTCMTLSAVPAASKRPSGLNTRLMTIASASIGGPNGRPVAVSQKWTA